MTFPNIAAYILQVYKRDILFGVKKWTRRMQL